MGINRDINTKDSSSRVREFFRLGGGNGYRRKVFLFGEGRYRVNGCGRLGG